MLRKTALLIFLMPVCHAAVPTVASGGTSNLMKFDLNGDLHEDLVLMSKVGNVIDRRQLLNGSATGFTTLCDGTFDNACALDSEDYVNVPETRFLTGDFNDDGKSDLVVISADPGFTRRGILLANFAPNAPAFDEVCVKQGDGECGFDTEPYMSSSRTRLLTGNFAGNGGSDILVISGSADFPRRAVLTFANGRFVETCIGDQDGACGFDTEPYMFTPRTRLLTGDFNGDGLTDVLVISGDPGFPRRTLLLSNGTSFTEACSGNQDGACGLDTEPYMFSADTKVITGDFNGDARTDLLVISGDPAFPRRAVLTSTGASFVEACVGNQDGACGFDTEAYMFHPNTRVIPGDFAGGLMTDILVISGDPAFPRRQLLEANGAGFREVCHGEQDGACGFDTEPYMFNPMTRELVGNFDGAGKDDVLVLSGDGAFPRRYLLLSNAAGFADGCASNDHDGCGIADDFFTQPWGVREMPRFSHNRPRHHLASTLKAEPDITRSLDWATRNGAELIELNGPSGTVYESGMIRLRSDQTLSWDAGVTLRARALSFPGPTDSFITIQDASNVHLLGSGGASLVMRKGEYHDGEWRHAVNALSAHDISVEGLRIADTGGDGIYISDSGNPAAPSTRVLISNVWCDNNSRNGLSVINVDGLEVRNSTFSNTRSLYPNEVAAAGPWSGIDFEPNSKEQRLSNISVHDVNVFGNKNFGILFALGNPEYSDQVRYSLPVTIDLARVSITGAVPMKAAVSFNYQAMSTIPLQSHIGLSALLINVSSSGMTLNQTINGIDVGVTTDHTCGFGVRPNVAFVCKIGAGNFFEAPTRWAGSWFDNLFIH
jgi:hypothetical protein